MNLRRTITTLAIGGAIACGGMALAPAASADIPDSQGCPEGWTTRIVDHRGNLQAHVYCIPPLTTVPLHPDLQPTRP
jgi:hypothetical protein